MFNPFEVDTHQLQVSPKKASAASLPAQVDPRREYVPRARLTTRRAQVLPHRYNASLRRPNRWNENLEGTERDAAMETWIGTNRRALGLGFTLPLILGAVGWLCIVWAPREIPWRWVGLGFGWFLLLFAGLLCGGLLWMLTIPRVAYRDGRVFFYLQLGPPIAVPLEAIEIFLVGQRKTRHGTVACVIVRLRDRCKEWHERNVSSALATWREGYVTIDGAWCEPVRPELLKRLNRRLRELQREHEAGAP